MICVGIDVAKDKHDCFILSSEGAVLADVFAIPNNMEGFNTLLEKLRACSTPRDSIKVGLEANEHYSCNILGFLLDNGLATYVLNPLRTNLYRKSLSLRKTKTDRVDARTIAAMLCCHSICVGWQRTAVRATARLSDCFLSAYHSLLLANEQYHGKQGIATGKNGMFAE